VIARDLTVYLVFTTLLVVTPGAATAVVVRNALGGGPRRGVKAAAGAALGNTIYAAISALGLAAVFARSPNALLVLRIAGTCYLAYLGVGSLVAAWQGRAFIPDAPQPVQPRQDVDDVRIGFMQGAAVNLVNPAVVTFYLTVVPTFLGGADTVSGRYALLAAMHVTLAFAFHCAWALALHSMRELWSRPAARRTLEALTGVALLVLAVKVAGVL
jgi:threonine/homoserine/homoserine lactone efflux protein